MSRHLTLDDVGTTVLASLADKFRGEWAIAENYLTGEIVQVGGESWFALTDSVAVPPTRPSEYLNEFLFANTNVQGYQWTVDGVARTWNDTSGSWLKVGTAYDAGGSMHNPRTAATDMAYVDLGADYDFEIGGFTAGVILRFNVLDGTQYCQWDGGTTVSRYDGAGGGWQPAIAIPGATGSGGATLRVKRRGHTYTFYRDGVQVGTPLTDASLVLTTGQSVGLWLPQNADVDWVKARTEQSAWALLASRGDDGAAGADGDPGSFAASYRDAWDTNTDYAAGDLVTYGGEVWLADFANSGAAPALPASLSDDFDRADLYTGGLAWVASGGTIDLSSNALRFATYPGSAYLDLPSAAGSVTVTTPASNTESGTFAVFATDPNPLYLSVTSGNTLRLGSTNSGTEYGSYMFPSAPWQNGRTIRLDYTATTAEVFVDGVSVLTATFAAKGGTRFKWESSGARTYPTFASFLWEGVATWTKVVAKGADGAEGPAGSAGPTGPEGPQGPAGTPWTRATAAVTTSSLAAGGQEPATITLPSAAAFRLYRISTDVPARVRLYNDVSKRGADLARPVGTDPTGDHGVILDFVTTSGMLTADLSPLVDGWLPGMAGELLATIDNLSGAAAAVTVTLTYVRTE